jgi:hypothetical protein
MDTKYCNGCKQTLSLDKFNLKINGDQITVRSRCKSCEAMSAKQYREQLRSTGKLKENKKRYYKNNPHKVREQSIRNFARRISINPDILADYVKKHSGVCDICHKPESITGTLHVDHCHETNNIRGMICNNCNTGLGHFQDSIENLKNAISYLKKKPIIYKSNEFVPFKSNSKQKEIHRLLETGQASVPKKGDYGFNSVLIAAVLGTPKPDPSCSTEKQCTKCHQVKPLSDFVKRPKRKSGRDSVCKKCHSERVYQSRRKNFAQQEP